MQELDTQDPGTAQAESTKERIDHLKRAQQPTRAFRVVFGMENDA